MAGTKLTFEVLEIDPDTTPHTPHLILPMEVGGEVLCPVHQGGRMTTAKVTNIHTYVNTASITSPGSPWTGVERPGLDESIGDSGEFSFAVPCGGRLWCQWVYSDDAAEADGGLLPAGAEGRVYVNGVYLMPFGPVFDPPGGYGGHTGSNNFEIPLTCRPCGNLITILFLANAYPG